MRGLEARRRVTRGLFALATCAVLAGCARTPTQLVVLVDSDMIVPSDFDEVRVVTYAAPTGGATLGDVTFALAAPTGAHGPTQFVLPLSFGVVPHGGDASRTVVIDVEARQHGVAAPLFVRRAITGFVPGHSLLLTMFLAGNCRTLAATCSDGQTCTEGGCVMSQRDPTMLPTVGPGSELDARSASDAPPSLDAVADSAVDAPFDAPRDGVGPDAADGRAEAGGVDAVCPMGSMLCAGACVDPRGPANCSTCGMVCASPRVCGGAVCSCPEGLAECGAACVDTNSDPANCHACGLRCPTGNSCADGGCVASCPTGTSACGLHCVNRSGDPENCGGCGTQCSFHGANATCTASLCRCGAGALLTSATPAICCPVAGTYTRSGCSAVMRIFQPDSAGNGQFVIQDGTTVVSGTYSSPAHSGTIAFGSASPACPAATYTVAGRDVRCTDYGANGPDSCLARTCLTGPGAALQRTGD